jgi:hypothetical protein
MNRILLAGLWLLMLATSTSAGAHEIRPGYLEIQQLGVDTYDVTWRVPGRGDGRLMIHALLPESCTNTTPIRSSRVPSGVALWIGVSSPVRVEPDRIRDWIGQGRPRQSPSTELSAGRPEIFQPDPGTNLRELER